jgi:hypothetical protein
LELELTGHRTTSDNDNVADRTVSGIVSPLVATGGVTARACVADDGVQLQLLKAGQSAGSDVPVTVLVSAGGDGKSEAQVATTTAGFGVAWVESDGEASSIRLRGVTTDGVPFGTEFTIGMEGRRNYGLAIDGHDVAGGPATGDLDGSSLNVCWVESPAGDASGVGRIMAVKFHVVLDGHHRPTDLMPASLNVASTATDFRFDVAIDAANDNAMWVGYGEEHGLTGALGSDPTVVGLLSGDVLVGWIDQANRVQAKLLPPCDAGPATARPGERAQAGSALPDVGEAAPPDTAARRLQCVELAPGSLAIMWVALGNMGPYLDGAIFSQSFGTSDEPVSTGAWARTAINPVVLPRAAIGEFQLSAEGANGSDLVVTYRCATDGTEALESFRHHVDVLGREPDWPLYREPQAKQRSQADPAVDDAGQSHDLWAFGIASSDPAISPAKAPAAARSGRLDTREGVDDLIGVASSSTDESSPIVSATGSSLIVAWQVPGSSADRVTVTLDIYDTQGPAVRRTTGLAGPIEVTRNADSHISPAISGLGSGAIAVWVDADTHALVARAFDRDGDALGPSDGVTVSAAGASSEISVACVEREHSDADGEADDQVAVVWVQDADAGGYGRIMLQRYGATPDSDDDDDENGSSLVALGGDGQADGDDGPGQVTIASGGEVIGVEGRSPAAAGLDDGQLALVWVENTGSEEHIRGKVIDGGDGHQLLVINLHAQLGGAGLIEGGTKPVLSNLGENGFLVSWLQPNGDGFDLVAAHYRAIDDGAWLPPEDVIRLRHFDEKPEEFSVVAAGDENLVATWRDAGSGGGHDVQVQRFDLQGNPIGDAFGVTSHRQSADDTSVSAGLPDGRVVVVLTEDSGNGDRDIVAHVFDASGAETGGDGDRGPSREAVQIDQSADHFSEAVAARQAASQEPHTSDSTDADTDIGNVAQAPDGKSVPVPQVDPAPANVQSLVVAAIDPTDGVTIDILPGDRAAYTVTAINGMTVGAPDDATGLAAPVRVADGFVQLRDDGQIVFSPDVTFAGSATFGCTVAHAALHDGTGTIHVSIVDGSSQRAPHAAGDDDGDRSTTFGDTLFFGDIILNYEGVGARHAIDEPASRYPMFDVLRDAGALAPIGDDIAMTPCPDNAASSDELALKFMTFDGLEMGYFKFS